MYSQTLDFFFYFLRLLLNNLNQLLLPHDFNDRRWISDLEIDGYWQQCVVYSFTVQYVIFILLGHKLKYVHPLIGLYVYYNTVNKQQQNKKGGEGGYCEEEQQTRRRV